MYKIRWSAEAKADVKKIYDFTKNKSVQGAKNVVTDIQNAPKTIVFDKQYSVDEYACECRKIVVRNYKILYNIDIENQFINVISVFDTRQSPDKLSDLGSL